MFKYSWEIQVNKQTRVCAETGTELKWVFPGFPSPDVRHFCLPCSLNVWLPHVRVNAQVLIIVLLRYNLHIIKWTDFRHTIQWFSLYLQRCAAIATARFRTSPSHPEDPSAPPQSLAFPLPALATMKLFCL